MSEDGDEKTRAADGAPARRCPICGKPAIVEYRPFCSKRCADVDLNRWLGGGYRIAGAPVDEYDGNSQKDDG